MYWLAPFCRWLALSHPFLSIPPLLLPNALPLLVPPSVCTVPPTPPTHSPWMLRFASLWDVKCQFACRFYTAHQLVCLRRFVLLFASLIFICQVCVSAYSFYGFLLFLLSPFVSKRFLTRYPQRSRYSLLPHTLTFLIPFFPEFAFLLGLVCQFEFLINCYKILVWKRFLLDSYSIIPEIPFDF